MVWVIVIIVLAGLGFLAQWYSIYVDSLPSVPDYIIDEGVTPELKKLIPDLLKKYAFEEYGTIPKEHLPLGRANRAFLERYARVSSDENLDIYDRLLLSRPYGRNSDYVQIGTSVNGDYILLRRNSSWDNVYIVNADEGDYQNPELYASSIENYLLMEYCLMQNQISDRHECR